MMLRVISLGAGVQSTTLALMAARGEIGPMPDCAIFADTGWEPAAVYSHLARLSAALPFPVHVVSGGDIRSEAIAGRSDRAGAFSPVPWFTVNADGSKGIGHRQCTSHYKIEPIRRRIVELCGGKRRAGQAEMWIGISTDEIVRMKPSRVKYITYRWPLIERRMNRGDCLKWLSHNGWQAPRSACIGCPFRSPGDWRSLTAEEFNDAVTVDRAIRDLSPGMKQFVHAARVPLDEVDLRSDEEKGQLNMFNNECEGMCGV